MFIGRHRHKAAVAAVAAAAVGTLMQPYWGSQSVSHVLQARLQLLKGPCVGDVLWDGGHHPVPSITLFFLPECSRQHWKGKENKKPRCLHWHVHGVVLEIERSRAASIKSVLLAVASQRIDPNLPEWVISSHQAVYASMAPCHSREAGSVHRNAVLMRALWKPVTRSHMKQPFMNFYLGGGGATCAAQCLLCIRLRLCRLGSLACLKQMSPQGDNKD